MKASDIPAKFPIPFAADAAAGFIRSIPVPPQAGGAASLTEGFPAPTFNPVEAGGIPPDGRDMNGVLNQGTAWSRWQGAGATVTYDADFATAIGGYPLGAVLRSASLPVFYQSTADDNATDPDSGGAANWVALTATGPTRIIDASGAFTIGVNDFSLGFARGAASSSTLPVAPPMGREIWIEDLLGNFDQFSVSIGAGAGQNIAGLPAWTFNVRRQCGRLKFYGSGTWSVKV